MLEYLRTAFTTMDIDFVVQLMAAEVLFVWRAPKRRLFVLRCILGICVCVLASVLWTGAGNRSYYSIAGAGYFVLAILRYLFLFALTLLALAFCFRLSFSETLFYGAGAYAAQHGTFSAMILFNVLLSSGMSVFRNNVLNELYTAAFFILFYIAVYLVFARRMTREKIHVGRLKVLFPALLLVLTSVAVNLYWFFGGSIDPVNLLYPIVCCVMALFILSGLFENSKLQTENEIINAMLEMKKDQGDLYKESINIVNTKCHDMKHQLAALLHAHADLREYAEEAIQRINIYDNIAKTGNEALDVVLTEKSLQCEANGIKFTYMADGDSIAFMSAADIYSLFGNALDNAIEGVKKVPPDRRVIEMNVFSSGGVATIHFGNFCGGDIVFENGLPLTTKTDRAYHGFGMKSIAFIAKKYGGAMTASADGGIFDVNVIMPLPSDFRDISGRGKGIS